MKLNSAAVIHFSQYCKALRLADNLITIEPCDINQKILIFLMQKVFDFFSKNITTIGSKNDTIWEETIIKLNLTKLDVSVYTSCQAIHFQRLYLCKIRHLSELANLRQRQLRHEAVQKGKQETYNDLPWDPVDMKAIEDDVS